MPCTKDGCSEVRENPSARCYVVSCVMLDAVGSTKIPRQPSKSRRLMLRFNKYQLIRLIIYVEEKPPESTQQSRRRPINSNDRKNALCANFLEEFVKKKLRQRDDFCRKKYKCEKRVIPFARYFCVRQKCE